MSVSIGVVVIGRNEGERLRCSLTSATSSRHPVIYVDSNSSDSSCSLARELGVHVVELGGSSPLSAARARNAGAAALTELVPECELICFIDGDCELSEGWLEEAERHLSSRPELAAVAGRRRERSPQNSVWNRLCDLEWNTPLGLIDATGGDFVIRAAAFSDVQGFDETFVAGEEPELGLRLAREGWKIERIDCEMTIHDADITRFSQWWQRCRRAGQAFLQGYLAHGRGPEHFWRREALRPLVWAVLIPALALGAITVNTNLSLAIAALFPLQAARIITGELRKGRSINDALVYSMACLAGHFAELSGQAAFLIQRRAGHSPTLVEYKDDPQVD